MKRTPTLLLTFVVGLSWILVSCRPAAATPAPPTSTAIVGSTALPGQPSATVTLTSAALPQEWIASTPALTWKDVPVMPGATSGGDKGGYYLYLTTTAPAEGADFYFKQMQSLGWKPGAANGTPQAGVVTLVFTKGQDTCTVGLIPHEGGTLVVLGRLSK